MHGLGEQYVLAASRGDLDGPMTGQVVLPNHLNWAPGAGARTYDLSSLRESKSLYTVVLQEAASIEDLHYLNWATLVGAWSGLRVPNRVRDM